MQEVLKLSGQSAPKKLFGGILEHWFVHIDENNRFRVIGSNMLTDNCQTELTVPVLYIDTQYWLAETPEAFYLLRGKDTSPENRAKQYEALKALGIDLQPRMGNR